MTRDVDDRPMAVLIGQGAARPVEAIELIHPEKPFRPARETGFAERLLQSVRNGRRSACRIRGFR
jgi:hypothetical protein